MLDWLLPQHLLLVAVPVAMVLAALSFAAGQRRAGARRARESLGRPQRAIDDAAEGERVLVEGVIEALEEPCARFEDGSPCAAATVESVGRDAGVSQGRDADDDAPGIAHGTRASVLVLAVGAERVAVDGPVDVFVGSRETDPRASFGTLAPDVRARIAAAADRASLPAPGASGLVHARPLFRSLATGDRVLAAGVLEKQSEGERTGYRERARWALRGDASSPVVLAYARSPQHRGPLSSALGGVRRVPAARVTVAAALFVGLLAGAAAAGRRARVSAPAPESAPVSMMASHFADAHRCAALKKDHAAAVERLGACAKNTDCVTQRRGGAHFGLEGCYRFVNRDLSSAEADRLEKAWLDEGCAASYEICPDSPPPTCREGRCVELPPAPIPETWHREDVPGGFFMYLPPGVRPAAAPGDDAADSAYAGDGMRIVSDFGESEPHVSEEAGQGKPVKVGGYSARVWRSPTEITLAFDRGKACEPPRCSHAQDDKLTLHVDCEGPAACNSAWLALQSVRFW